ncbi:DoxX family protein [Streptomyces formicae]|uniref:DoxX family protein n=1 Tax=Streptomyces formicae TaxID=1616117 RepID=A0ABY3WRZ3_9ACTN|nr:DoxX family protein [Streptomyces formicae]UNM14430.1 DoxX family protein [Streptomyces formicae]
MSAHRSTAAATTAAAGTTASYGTPPSRRTHVAVLTLQILLALFLGIASAAPKLIGHESAATIFDEIGLGGWFMYLVGALELAGAVGLVIPLLSGVSALALIGLMIGAFITQVTALGGEYWYTPVLMAILFGIIAWVRRGRTVELVALLRARL